MNNYRRIANPAERDEYCQIEDSAEQRSKSENEIGEWKTESKDRNPPQSICNSSKFKQTCRDAVTD